MAFISAETGTLTFAITSLVFNIFGALASIGCLVAWVVAALYHADEIRSSYARHLDETEAEAAFIWVSMFTLGLCIISLFYTLISLVFSSFLMNGILKKKPEYIKVYFIFGVVKTILALLVVTFSAVAVLRIDVLPPVASAFVIFGIYSLILHMIRHTYKKLEQINLQYGHKPLAEKY